MNVQAETDKRGAKSVSSHLRKAIYNFSLFICGKLNYIFLFSAAAVLLSHILFSRGLDRDGSMKVAKMLLLDRFPWSEITRWIFHRIYHLPFYLSINFFHVKSLPVLTAIYSFGLISLHLLSFFVCYLILPKDKKHLFFFPLFAFLTGPATSLGISVSIALSVCSYVWLLSFLIYYSDLSVKWHKILFILCPLPLILSHEMMIYIFPPLIFLCLSKQKKESGFWNKKIISFSAAALFIMFLYSIWLMLFSKHEENYAFFQKNLFHFEFIFYEALNTPILFSMILTAALFGFCAKSSLRKKIHLISFLLISGGFALVFTIFPFFGLLDRFLPYSDYSARVYPPTISLVSVLIVWYVWKDRSINFKKSPYFVLSCLIFCAALVFSRARSDYMFYRYQKDFSKIVKSCYGLVPWDSFRRAAASEGKRDLLKRMEAELWKISSSALIYPRSKNVKAAIFFPEEESIKICLKRGKFEYEDCEHIAKTLNLFSPETRRRFARAERFFNFTALSENISKGISFCESAPPGKSGEKPR